MIRPRDIALAVFLTLVVVASVGYQVARDVAAWKRCP